MRCPSCAESLHEFDHDGVAVDVCSGCRGIWFDLGELERLTRGIFPWGEALGLQAGTCPRCVGDGALESRRVVDSKLTLDLCRRCGGVFVPAGGVRRLRQLTRRLPGAERSDAARDRETLATIRSEKRRRQALWPRGPTFETTSADESWLTWFAWIFELPLEEVPQGRRDPWMTLALSFSLVVAFVWQIVGVSAALLDSWALVPDEVRSGASLSTLLTSVWVHASWPHLIGNVFTLWIFGDDVEEAIGHLPLLAWFLISGLAGSLTTVALAGGEAAAVPHVGASSAVLGVAVAYSIWFPRRRLAIPWLGVGPLGTLLRMPALVWLLMTVLVQAVGLLTDLPGVAWWDHLGGMTAGLLGALLWRPRAR